VRGQREERMNGPLLQGFVLWNVGLCLDPEAKDVIIVWGVAIFGCVRRS